MKISTITTNFYDAVWDLAERVAMLPSALTSPSETPIEPSAKRAKNEIESMSCK